MTANLGRNTVLFLVLVLAASSLLAAIPNWPAPATWSPPRAHTGLTTMGDVTNPLPFVGSDPCRIADTRNSPGPYGAPSLSAGSPRNFMLVGQCAIPFDTPAVSLNVTVTNTQGPGFILIYPAGGAQPTVSTLNYVAGQTIANAAVVPLGKFASAGMITVVAGVSGTDLILDMNGYYAGEFLNPSEGLLLVGSNPGTGVVQGQNNSTATDSTGVWGRDNAMTGVVFGVDGQTSSTTAGAAGVRGRVFPTTGLASGVIGGTGSTTDGAAGVYGTSTATAGKTSGVTGSTSSTTGGSAGVLGFVNTTVNSATYGVKGLSGPGTNAAGVLGLDSTGLVTSSNLFDPAGVRGESKFNFAIVGLSQNSGVVGELDNSAGSEVAQGFLGTAFGVAMDSAGAPWGVFASGNLGATGAKHFVEPHPSDPTKVILYSSLEGREVGTYFRGTGRIVNHQAVIEVPEDFRIVTDEEGLTVQLTPVGELATLAVINQDLNQIVVKASRDVTFHYLVQGVRRAFKDLQPIRVGYEFVPRSRTDTLQPYLNEEARRRLIANGTYNADGTVNMETAERLGWAKMWKDREERTRAAAAANAAAHAALMGEKK